MDPKQNFESWDNVSKWKSTTDIDYPFRLRSIEAPNIHKF